MDRDPFHEGEHLAHERAGSQEDARRNARMISPAIHTGAVRFFSGLGFLAVAVTAGDAVRACVVAGEPGFARATEDAVEIDLDRVTDDPDGALATSVGTDVGLLAIDLATRRRYRVNGRLEQAGPRSVKVAVREAYPNCPQYIRARRVVTARSSAAPRGVVRGERLGPEQVALVGRAETTFVASRHPERGLDASHRGGPAGFVTVVAPDRLRIPDYEGNGLFNTLGNLLADPRAGLALLDFEGGRILEMSGRATIEWAPERAWELSVERFTERDLPLTSSDPSGSRP